MKPLCVVDTCSLIYLSEIELAKRSLHRWLFDEFEVVYSQLVWENEIQAHFDQMGSDGARLRQRNAGAQRVWEMASANQYEQALFNSFSRIEQVGQCDKCRQPIWREREVKIDLASDRDKGERHNCGVALDAVRGGKHRQVIFLTDDHNAIRQYVQPIFETFPLGCVWSSYDFVLYLFMRHRTRTTPDEIKTVFRDITAKAADEEKQKSMKSKTQAVWQQRLGTYFRKVDRVAQVISRLP